MRRLSTLSLLVLASMPSAPGAGTLFVDAAAAGTATGASWANAFRELQDALDVARPGDQVWVARGTYRPDRGAGQTPGDRSATFAIPDGVEVYGGFDGTETQLGMRAGLFDETVLSGDLLGDDAFAGTAENSFHVVTTSGTGPATRLDGFTIRAGNANGYLTDRTGAGLLNLSGSPQVRRCTFVDNYGQQAGAGVTTTGASDPLFERCTFLSNRADYGGGGGMWSSQGSVRLVSCRFFGNVSGRHGGALYLFGPITSSLQISGCVMSGNSAVERGGAVYQQGPTRVTYTGCTIAGNSAGFFAGGVQFGSGISPVSGCVFWGNSDATGAGQSAQLTGNGAVSYSCVDGLTGGFGGVGNVGADPLFVSELGMDGTAGTLDDDLRLGVDSPCIDAADNGALPADVSDLDGDGDTVEPLPLDLADTPRLADDAFTPDTGAGTAPILDMGAFEFVPPLPLVGDTASISLLAGGAQNLTLAVHGSLAGRIYLLLGSTIGTEPGISLDPVTLPLNVDAYTLHTLLNPSAPPLSGSVGLLDANGEASMAFALPPATSQSLAGVTVHHAALVLDTSTPAPFLLATNAVAVDLVP